MLKGIDPVLTADLLHALAAMGHGDVLALVDRNYPAAATARRLVELPGTDVPRAARAILRLFPVDDFVEPPVLRMRPINDDTTPEVHRALLEEVDAAEGRAVRSETVDRFEFYARARDAFVVVATTEARPYGCFLLTKGVVRD